MSLEKIQTTDSLVETPENIDRKSISFFRRIRDEMIQQIGIPSEDISKYSLYKLKDELVNLQSINSTLQERPEKFPGKVLDIVKDKFREKVPTRFLDPERSFSFGGKNIEFIKKIKTIDLVKWRESAREYLKKLEKFETPLSMLHEVELDPEIKELLAKYNKTKVYELLEPEFEIEKNDLWDLSYNIVSSFEYRNRKIKEFVAYRYARSAQLKMDIGEFTLNAHSILESKKEDTSYRKSFLENSDGFNAPVPPNLVSYGMSKLNETIKNVEQSSDKKQIKKEALRYYILFEIIHPFEDGNGRVGRSLFVYLQRLFSDKKLILEKPTHIPISRYQSGTIYPQEIKDGKFKRNAPGSISLDVNTLLTRIIQREEIVSLGKDLLNYIAFDPKNFNPYRYIEGFDKFFEATLGILNSEEVGHQIEEMIEVIEKQSSLDDMVSPDWNMVYDSMKESLKK